MKYERLKERRTMKINLKYIEEAESSKEYQSKQIRVITLALFFAVSITLQKQIWKKTHPAF